MRKTGSGWSGKLVGDGDRFSCFYERSLNPRSDWEEIYRSLVDMGLFELEGVEEKLGWEDGNRFEVETVVGAKRTAYEVDNPAHRDSARSRRIMRVSEMISREFDTPVFDPDDDLGAVGKYLIDTCMEHRGTSERGNSN